MDKVCLHDKTFTLYLGSSKIQKSIEVIADSLNNDYADKNPVFIGILNGSFLFVADLVRRFKGNCDVSFIRLSSYEGTSSKGVVDELIGLHEDIQNRDVVVLEDIVDTGNTLEKVFELLIKKKPRTIKIATFLFKPGAYTKNIPIDYCALEVGNDFLVGYGLDYNGLGRNLENIYVVEE